MTLWLILWVYNSLIGPVIPWLILWVPELMILWTGVPDKASPFHISTDKTPSSLWSPHFQTAGVHHCLLPPFSSWYIEFDDKIEACLSGAACIHYLLHLKSRCPPASLNILSKSPALRCKWARSVCMVGDKAVNNELILGFMQFIIKRLWPGQKK